VAAYQAARENDHPMGTAKVAGPGGVRAGPTDCFWHPALAARDGPARCLGRTKRLLQLIILQAEPNSGFHLNRECYFNLDCNSEFDS